MSLDKAKKYIQGIMSGEVLAGHWIKAVIERHLSDLEKQADDDYPYFFSDGHAEYVFDCFSLFKLAKGSEAGKPFDLMPYHAAILYLAYGWRRKSDKKRRFKKVYIKVARGNAKTEFLAAVGTFGFVFEGEKDPEVYWAATKKDQSRIGFDRQKRMMDFLRADVPEISHSIGMSKYKIYTKQGLGWVGYLGEDSSTEDGASPYYGLIDEYHAHKTDGMLNVLESGMNKRRDKMTWIITTAGYNPEGPNSEFLKSCKDILSGLIPNDEILPFIFELDEDDDWKDESVWTKANPGLGISVDMEGMRSSFREAVSMGGTKERDFKVKNLNYELSSGESWVKDEAFTACPDYYEDADLQGGICYGGIDLASTQDFSAMCLLWPDGEIFIAKWWLWLPEEAFTRYLTKFPIFRKWREQGYITVTPGNVMDYDYIKQVVLDVSKWCEVKSLAHDPHNAQQLMVNLGEAGVNCYPLSQGIVTISTPTKEVERAILSQKINHGGNPVIRWMLSNVSVYRDSNDNIRLHKGKSAYKIDGIAALVNAMGAYMNAPKPFNSYLMEEGAKLIYL